MSLLDTLAQKSVLFVGGKGGVGKTTSAAALALRFANAGRKTLVISTDPAHSLGDAFGEPLSHRSKAVCANLDALELNPQVILEQHFKQVERTLEGYTKPEMMAKMRDFLRLSRHAPGAEEAAMLEALCQHLLGARVQGYQHVIFDTAPTGHTLRLLSLPEMMQAWTDGLLAQQRRQSRLRGAVDALDKQKLNPLAPARKDRWADAVDVLEKRRRLFAHARDVLHDTAQTAIVLVLIPEALPLAETERAVAQLAESGMPCAGLFVNQVMAVKQQDSFWQQRADRQQDILDRFEHSLGYLPQQHIALHAADVRGLVALSTLFGEK
ncbi:ArsA family ATPase [Cardiobacteriaceae bacterium TAE3-ERU3]|nr:ArsA family ATPase [Cardiobacteriaceae bacterium TAE3-ERU3]